MTDSEKDNPYFDHRPTLEEFFGWEGIELRKKGKSNSSEKEEFFCLREILFLTMVPGAVSSDGSGVEKLFDELFAKFKEPIGNGNVPYFWEFSLTFNRALNHVRDAFAASHNIEKWLILARKRFVEKHGRAPGRREGKQLALRLMASFWLRNENPTEDDVQKEIEKIKGNNLKWTQAFDSLGWKEGSNQRGRPRKNSPKSQKKPPQR